MYVVWLSPGGSGGFTGIFRDAEICPGFTPPQAALVIATSREKGLLNLNLNLNLNSLLVKRQIDNPSPGAVTGGN